VDFEDRHVTVTPEGISLDVVLAGLGSRFVAFALDFTFQVAALIGFAIVVISAFHGSASTTNGLVEGGAFSLFVLVDFIGYFIFCDRLTCRPRERPTCRLLVEPAAQRAAPHRHAARLHLHGRERAHPRDEPEPTTG
jgi:hypothetical protein